MTLLNAISFFAMEYVPFWYDVRYNSFKFTILVIMNICLHNNFGLSATATATGSEYFGGRNELKHLFIIRSSNQNQT